MTRNYWWPGVIKDVGKLIVNEILKRLWMYLTVNFIIKLLLVVKKNVILVVCDRLSKISYFGNCRRNISRRVDKAI